MSFETLGDGEEGLDDRIIQAVGDPLLRDYIKAQQTEAYELSGRAQRFADDLVTESISSNYNLSREYAELVLLASKVLLQR